jgi:hypothetical protein
MLVEWAILLPTMKWLFNGKTELAFDLKTQVIL